jgi:hybrid cluster-associated redox disulfide protein
MNKKISKTDNLLEILQKFPNVVEVLLDYGMHCLGCPAMASDTLEVGAKVHGIEDNVIDEMVERMNEVVEHNE